MTAEATVVFLIIVLACTVALWLRAEWRHDTERTRRLLAEDHYRAQAETADAAVRQAAADRATTLNAVHANAELQAQRDAARHQLRRPTMGRD